LSPLVWIEPAAADNTTGRPDDSAPPWDDGTDSAPDTLPNRAEKSIKTLQPVELTGGFTTHRPGTIDAGDKIGDRLSHGRLSKRETTRTIPLIDRLQITDKIVSIDLTLSPVTNHNRHCTTVSGPRE
jgi:hypothetical protein